MSRKDRPREIARALRKQSLYFSDGWNSNMLQAFIRDGGCCVYCGTKLLKEFGPSCEACGDHLLPKSKYPKLAENVNNCVPACADCNRTKHDYDPSGRRGMKITITESGRRDFIRKSREVIKRRKMEGRRFFRTGKIAFKQAAAQYRQC
jgi:hypothetical protein